VNADVLREKDDLDTTRAVMMKDNKYRILCMLTISLLLFAAQAIAAESSYDPLAISARFTPEILDLTVHDAERDRDIPIRVYLPSEKSPVPVVLFSHGLGGSREGSAYLGNHWAARGYVAVFLQHPGSDTSVWKDKPLGQRMEAMQEAAGAQNFLLRVKDVPAVLDQLDRWEKTDRHVLAGRLDTMRIGMSGHSFGAVTTQAVSGQNFGRGKLSFTDPRIKAAIVFSPSSPRRGGDPQQAFGNVKIPWMLMTGTKDIAPIGDADMESRLAVFPALPPNGKYELVLYGAEHSAFTDRALPGDVEKRNPNHHRAILALSTAFWDSYLRDNRAAKTWLDGDSPRSVLEKDDRWQKK
jgi:predicted dienelactone hydrolase